jgi:hypothetical protein
MEEKIIIESFECKDPAVDATLARLQQEADFREGKNVPPVEDANVSLIYKGWFSLMLAGMLGAFIGWALIEPLVTDNDPGVGGYILLMLFLVTGLTGLFIGCAEGILARNPLRAVRAGGIGFLMAIVGMGASLLVGGLFSSLTDEIARSVVGIQALSDPLHHTNAFIYMMVRRSMLWVFIGMGIGLGPGIGIKSKKMVLNGFIGGMLGGLIGGLLFDPIDLLFYSGQPDYQANISRMIGFTILGAGTGLFIGMVETLSKDAWLLMTDGPLKGKQFIVYKNPTTIGSSPQCEIYLFRDVAIDEVHAKIHIGRDGYLIEDNRSNGGVFVNGTRITNQQKLKSGDQIQIGSMSFIYSEKEKKKKS